MGAWGTAIFSDDTACDVRDSYRDLVGDGKTAAEASELLLNEWSKSLEDPDEGPVFWLALAATQWKCGHLQPNVLRQALHVIDGGSDLSRWDTGSRDWEKRRVVLQQLRAQLSSPQPPEKRIPRRFRDSNEWRPGDLVAYRLLSGRLVILRIIGHHTDRGGTAPICELLDWVGKQLPNRLRLGSLKIRKSKKAHSVTHLIIGRTKAAERPDDRLQHLGGNLAPSQRPPGCTVVLWRWLDRVLKEEFGVE
jgi:hypothetical protein